MKNFNNKPKDKVKNIFLSVLLGVSILTNIYLFAGKQNLPQNVKVSASAENYQKQISDLKNENDKLTAQVKDLTKENNETQTKITSITEENKNLTTKVSQLQNEKTQQANNQGSEESSKVTQSSHQMHSDHDKGSIVYKTRTGNKYHRSGCGYLSRSCYETTRSSAESEGLSPCSRCNP